MEEHSNRRKIFEIIFTLFLSMLFFWLFYNVIVLLYKGIFFKHEIIVFKKSSMYLFGGGIFCAFLTFFGIKYFANNKAMADNKKDFYIMFIVPIAISVIIPQIISFYVHTHIENIHFIKCEKESETGFRYTKYVFAKDLKTCTKYEAYEEKMR